MSDAAVVVMAACAAAGAWWAHPVPVLPGLVLVLLGFGGRRAALLCAGVAVLTTSQAARAWSGTRPPLVGAYSGSVTLIGDPTDVDAGVRVDVRLRGKRVQAWAWGAPARALSERLAGERVAVSGRVRPLTGRSRVWLHRRHVVGRLSVTAVGEWAPASGAAALANRVRRTLMTGAAAMAPERRSLFSGFVLGDDRGQPPEVASDFRSSGLAHLLVVSGQNVAFTLALLAPLVAGLGVVGRAVAGAVALAFFGLVVRWEPSVVRAIAMAAITLSATVLGRPVTALRVLALAVTAVLLIDPLLVGSLGFLMSVGACAGMIVVGREAARLVPGPQRLAAAAGLTLGAQLGVAPVLATVFGGVPVASLPANLLALPAAGPTMMWGLVAGVPAGLAGEEAARVLLAPAELLLTWIAGVARVAVGLPLGWLRGPHLLALTALGVGAWLASRGGHDRAARAAVGMTLLVLLVPAVHAARPPDVTGRQLVTGVRLWRHDGANVLVMDRPRPDRLLDALHRADVRRVDVVVGRRFSRRMAEAVATVGRRLPVRLVLVPPGPQVPGFSVVEAPRTLAVGGVLLHVAPEPGGLVTRVTRVPSRA